MCTSSDVHWSVGFGPYIVTPFKSNTSIYIRIMLVGHFNVKTPLLYALT